MPKSKKRKLKSKKVRKTNPLYALPLGKDPEGNRLEGYSVKLNKPKAIGSLLTVSKITNWDTREALIEESEELLQAKLEDQTTLKELVGSENKDEVLIKKLQGSIMVTDRKLEKANLQLRNNKLRTKQVRMRVTKYIYVGDKYLTMLQDVT